MMPNPLDNCSAKNQQGPVSNEGELSLAMTHQRLGDRAVARKSFKAAQFRLGTKPPRTARLRQLYKEAQTLLGVVGSSRRLPVVAPRPAKLLGR